MRTIVTTMRNEAPFILEWLAYHRHLGFTDFVIFSNDCADGTDRMLDRLQQMGLVAHLDNPRRGQRPVQWTALRRAAHHPLVKKAEWLFVTDVDEFLNIHAGAGRLDDLIAACPEAEGFLIAWRMFGANGHQRFEDGLMTRHFTAAAPDRLVWPWRAVQFKALFRNDGRLDKLGVHRPQLRADTAPLRWFDDSGNPAGAVPGTMTAQTGPRYGLAQINHYALGSVESFMVKVDRGKPNHSDDSIDLAYWIDRNLNAVEDRSILRHDAAVAEGLAALLQDPELARLHAEGVAWRHKRIAALMLASDSFYLQARIRQTPPTRILPMAEQVQLLRGLMAMRRAQAEMRRAEAPHG